MNSPRVIMHIDINAFFASVEQQSKPFLRGRPVAVVGRDKRTIILTASYEARQFGVKTAMTLHRARQKCPSLILVRTNNRLYTDVSRRMIEMLRDYSPLIEVFSVDEVFIDVTGSIEHFGSVRRIAFLIKSRLKARFGLRCSIGIAPNKLLAKLASDMEKPDGLVVIEPDRVSEVLADRPVGELCGIGKRTREKLNLMGIMTCGQLGRYPVRELKARFGVIGPKLALMGRGVDTSPVLPPEQEPEVKTVSHSMTLSRDLNQRHEMMIFIRQMAEMVGRRARRYRVRGRVVTLTVRYRNFSTFSRQRRQAVFIDRSMDIYQAALQIFDALLLTHPVRLLGVCLSDLQYHQVQMPLLEDERKADDLTRSLDQVNDRYGEFSVMPGSLLNLKARGSQVISPAWRPEGIRNVKVL